MDSQDTMKETKKISKSRRNSILKEVENNEENVPKVIATSRRSLKRVSFADTTSIKEFLATRDAVTEWNHTYEEPVIHHDSFSSMEITRSVQQTTEILVQENVVMNTARKEKDESEDFEEISNFLSKFIGSNAPSSSNSGKTCNDDKENDSAMDFTCNYKRESDALQSMVDSGESKKDNTKVKSDNPAIVTQVPSYFETMRTDVAKDFDDVTCAIPTDIDMTCPVDVAVKVKEADELEKSVYFNTEIDEDSCSEILCKESDEMDTKNDMLLTTCAGTEYSSRDMTCATPKDIEFTCPVGSNICAVLADAESAPATQGATGTNFSDSDMEMKILTENTTNSSISSSHPDMNMTCAAKGESMDSDSKAHEERVTTFAENVHSLNCSEETANEIKTNSDEKYLENKNQDVFLFSTKPPQESSPDPSAKASPKSSPTSSPKISSSQNMFAGKISECNIGEVPLETPSHSLNLDSCSESFDMEMTEGVVIQNNVSRSIVSEDQIAFSAEMKDCEGSKHDDNNISYATQEGNFSTSPSLVKCVRTESESTVKRESESLHIVTDFEAVNINSCDFAVSPLVDDVFTPDGSESVSSPAVPDEILGLLTAPITNREKHIIVNDSLSNKLISESSVSTSTLKADKDLSSSNSDISQKVLNIVQDTDTCFTQKLDDQTKKLNDEIIENVVGLDVQATNSIESPIPSSSKKRRSDTAHSDEPSFKARAKDTENSDNKMNDDHRLQSFSLSAVEVKRQVDPDEEMELLDDIEIDLVEDDKQKSLVSSAYIGSTSLSNRIDGTAEPKSDLDKSDIETKNVSNKCNVGPLISSSKCDVEVKKVSQKYDVDYISTLTEKFTSSAMSFFETISRKSSVGNLQDMKENINDAVFEETITTKDDIFKSCDDEHPASPAKCDTSGVGTNDSVIDTFLKEYEEIEDSDCSDAGEIIELEDANICLEVKKNTASLIDDGFCRLCTARMSKYEHILMFEISEVKEGWLELQLKERPLKIHLDLVYHEDHQMVVKANYAPQYKDLKKPFAKLGMKFLGYLIGNKVENLSGLHLCAVEDALKDILSAYEIVMDFVEELYYVQATNIVEFTEDGLKVTLSNVRSHLCISIIITLKKPLSKQGKYPIITTEPIINIGNMRRKVLEDALSELENTGKQQVVKIVKLMKSYC